MHEPGRGREIELLETCRGNKSRSTVDHMFPSRLLTYQSVDHMFPSRLLAYQSVDHMFPSRLLAYQSVDHMFPSRLLAYQSLKAPPSSASITAQRRIACQAGIA